MVFLWSFGQMKNHYPHYHTASFLHPVSQYNEIVNEIPSVFKIQDYNAKLWKMSTVVLFLSDKD